MFKATITNASKNLSWGGQFQTELEAQEWLQKQIGKPNRLPERTVPIDSEYEQEDVLEVIEQEVDGVIQQTSVKLKAQFIAEIIDISAEVEQSEINRQAKAFLQESDYKIIRHLGQKALGQQTSLSEEEYLALEQQRQQARNSIVGE
jgi:hypothetical protein